MLNFRYHVVSLVAVFLALGLGILVGYGALDRPTVDFLQTRIQTVEANAEQRRQENDQLESEVDQLDQAIGATAPFAVTDRRTDVPVLVVAVRGVESDLVTGAVELARLGGASAPGIVWLEERWDLAGEDDPSALVAAASVSSGSKAEVRRAAFEAFTTRLAVGDDSDDDVLRPLVDAGFVALEGPDDTQVSLADIGGSGTRILLVVGTEDSLRTRQVLLPIAGTAVERGLLIVAAEEFIDSDNDTGRGALVGNLRSDETLAARVSTVDDLDHPSGRVVALLALADLGRTIVGHYGFGEGATAAAPEWWQP